MRVRVDISRAEMCPLEDTFFCEVTEKTLQISGFDFLQKRDVDLSVALVSPDEIRMLNKTYRHKDKVTDVLSFPEYADKEEMVQHSGDSVFLGELILCYDYIKEAAHEDGVSLEQEMAYILSHGVLHLLGFDHSEEMFALQDTVSEAYA